MFNLRYPALSCAALISLTISSHAATIDFGLITGDVNNDSRSWMDTVSGTFADYALFQTSKTANFAASITNSYATGILFIDDLTLSLYTGSVIGSGTKIASVTGSNANNPPGTQSISLVALAQGAGSYYLSVTGTTADSPSYGGSLAVAVSAVPLPATAPLFGAALVTFGVIGYAAQKKKAAAA